MKCIKDELIQKYIDGEVSDKEIARIEKHVKSCSLCAQRIVDQRMLAESIRNAINRLNPDPHKVPQIHPTIARYEKPALSLRRIAYVAAAACLFLTIMFFSLKKKPDQQDVFLMVPDFAGDVDANRPISKQSLIIQIIDPEGNVYEYFGGPEEIYE